MISKLTLEKWYPRTIAIAISGLVITLCGNNESFYDYIPQGESMLESLVGLGGILAGFLATMKTMLMSMRKETLDRLKQSGYMPHLKDYISEALAGSIILCGAAIIGFSPVIKNSQSPLFLAIIIGLLFYSISTLYRVTRIGMGLLTR